MNSAVSRAVCDQSFRNITVKDPQLAGVLTFTRSAIAQGLSIHGPRKMYVSSVKGFVFKVNAPGIKHGLSRVKTQVFIMVLSPLVPVIWKVYEPGGKLMLSMLLKV